MEIGQIVAAHQQFANRTARLYDPESMIQAVFEALNFMRETALQGFARVIQALLRIPYTVEQLASQRPRAPIDLPL
jgi:hypothetical protein